MAPTDPHASKSRSDATSNSDSDSEDDDFVPEPETAAAASSSRTFKARTKPASADDASDQDSDDAGSDNDGQTAGKAADGEPIDADELEALKREREEMVAAAGGEDRLGKRRRLAANATPESTATTPANDEAESLKAKALADWEAIKTAPPTEGAASSNSSSVATAEANPSTSTSEETISIPTTYKFAGEIHTSTRLLPRTHPDAIKYLSSLPSSTSPAPAPAPAPTSISPAPRPPPASTGPRRKKQSSLSALSAAAVSSKPAKLNTLEKSKLDWDTYKANSTKLSQHELDELEHQTKGGGKGLGDMKGYLERRDFLDRVKDRTGQP